MLLTRLHLENIRSYRRATIDLAPGLTYVLGPNGAGKSTIPLAVGCALFGVRDYGRLLRKGAGSGRVVACFRPSASEPAFAAVREIERRADDGFAGDVWYVAPYDEEAGRDDVDRGIGRPLAEKAEAVQALLRERLRLPERATAPDVFVQIVGVPQGELVAAFLLPERARRETFDAVFDAQRYEKLGAGLKPAEDLVVAAEREQHDLAIGLEAAVEPYAGVEAAHAEKAAERRRAAAALSAARTRESEARAAHGRALRLAREVEALAREAERTGSAVPALAAALARAEARRARAEEIAAALERGASRLRAHEAVERDLRAAEARVAARARARAEAEAASRRAIAKRAALIERERQAEEEARAIAAGADALTRRRAAALAEAAAAAEEDEAAAATLAAAERRAQAARELAAGVERLGAEAARATDRADRARAELEAAAAAAARLEALATDADAFEARRRRLDALRPLLEARRAQDVERAHRQATRLLVEAQNEEKRHREALEEARRLRERVAALEPAAAEEERLRVEAEAWRRAAAEGPRAEAVARRLDGELKKLSAALSAVEARLKGADAIRQAALRLPAQRAEAESLERELGAVEGERRFLDESRGSFAGQKCPIVRDVCPKLKEGEAFPDIFKARQAELGGRADALRKRLAAARASEEAARRAADALPQADADERRRSELRERIERQETDRAERTAEAREAARAREALPDLEARIQALGGPSREREVALARLGALGDVEAALARAVEDGRHRAAAEREAAAPVEALERHRAERDALEREVRERGLDRAAEAARAARVEAARLEERRAAAAAAEAEARAVLARLETARTARDQAARDGDPEPALAAAREAAGKARERLAVAGAEVRRASEAEREHEARRARQADQESVLETARADVETAEAETEAARAALAADGDVEADLTRLRATEATERAFASEQRALAAEISALARENERSDTEREREDQEDTEEGATSQRGASLGSVVSATSGSSPCREEGRLLERLRSSESFVRARHAEGRSTAEASRRRYDEARADHDPGAVDRLQAEVECAGQDAARLATEAAHRGAEEEALARRVEEARTLRARLETARTERGRRRFEANLLHFLRNRVFKKAGPYIVSQGLHRIGAEANRLFQRIRGASGETLAWREGYQVEVRRATGERLRLEDLSGGEQMAAALAIRLALLRGLTDLRFGFFDEPTAHLDPARRTSLASSLTGLDLTGLDQLFVMSHDEVFAAAAHHVLELDRPDDDGSFVRAGRGRPAPGETAHARPDQVHPRGLPADRRAR